MCHARVSSCCIGWRVAARSFFEWRATTAQGNRCQHLPELFHAALGKAQAMASEANHIPKTNLFLGAAGASPSDFRTVLTQVAASGCKANVQDLTPGTQYHFQVYAVNNQGASPASSIGTQHQPGLQHCCDTCISLGCSTVVKLASL